MFEQGDYRHHQQAVYARLAVAERAGLSINLLVAAGLAGTVAVAPGVIAEPTWSWSALALYLVALRYFLTNLAAVSRVFTATLRHYPALSRYWRFVRDAEQAVQAGSATAGNNTGTLEFKLVSLQGDGESLRLSIPGEALLVHPGPPDRGVIAILLAGEKSIPGVSVAGAWFNAGLTRCDGTLRQCLGLPESLSDEQFPVGQVGLLGSAIGHRLRSCRLDGSMKEFRSMGLDAEALATLEVLGAYWSQDPVVLLDGVDMRCAGVGPDPVATLLKDRLVLTLFGPGSRLPDGADRTPVLLSDGRRLVGWCRRAWLRDHPGILRTLTIESKAATRGQAGFDDQADDEL
jgi:ABC-type multidrug transport system fused ATPase/permease subunit